jgi:hypothetical protein
MMYRATRILFLFFITFTSVSCSRDGESNVEVARVNSPCVADFGINYICGPINAEDLLSIGDTGLIITSGMNGGLDGTTVNGHIYLVDSIDDSWEDLVTASGFSQDLDFSTYPNCPGELNINDFSAHGLALKQIDPNNFDLYITSHGAREAIEIFTLNIESGPAKLTWRGCVPLDETIMHNSLAILSDGGFITTQFMTWDGGVESAFSGEVKGSLVTWRPGGQPTIMPGSELVAPNGIVVSEDERYIYVAAFGAGGLVRFDLAQNPVKTDSIALDILPDNVRWGESGKLLTAGGNVNGDGWSVIEIDAASLEAIRIGGLGSDAAMQGVSSALQVGNDIWVGTYSGDRIGYFAKE